MNSSLKRSKTDRMVGGVIGGIAKKFNMNSALLRIVFVLCLLFLSGFPLIVYLLMWFFVPEEG